MKISFLFKRILTVISIVILLNLGNTFMYSSQVFIISLNFLDSGVFEYLSIINGLIFFFIYNFAILLPLMFWILSQGEFNLKNIWKIFYRTFLPIFAIFLVSNILKILIQYSIYNGILEVEYQNIIFLIVETIYTYISFVIIKKSIHKNIKISKTKQETKTMYKFIYFIIGILIIAVFVCYSVYNIFIYNRVYGFIEKYNILNFPGDMSSLSINDSFKLQFIELVYRIFLYSGFTVIFGKINLPIDNSNHNMKSKWLKYIIFVLFCVCFIFLKVSVLPQESICQIQAYTEGKLSEKHMGFQFSYDIFKIRRYANPLKFQLNNIDVYYKKTVVIAYDDKVIRSFDTIYDEIETPLQKVEIDNIEAYHYTTEALAFLDNEEPKVLLVSEINSQKENKILTKVLEELIKEGYFEFLEYSCEYMLKYDEAFVKPYIERYSKGELTERELEVNAYLEEEYMIDFAKVMMMLIEN